MVEKACKGDVKGYLQLTDHIIQQIKWAEVKEDPGDGPKKDLKQDLKDVSTYTFNLNH